MPQPRSTAKSYFTIRNSTTREQIKEQYRRLAKVYHPDVHGSPEAMKAINSEYEWLKKNHVDPKPRPAPEPIYDRKLYRIIPAGIDVFKCVLPKGTFDDDVTIFFLMGFAEFKWSHARGKPVPVSLDVTNVGRKLRIDLEYETAPSWMDKRNVEKARRR